jgi:hypothetical protein
MVCEYKLCDHWTWDGDGSCWWGLTGDYKNTCSNNSADGTPVLGGHGCGISSYRIAGCDNYTVTGYYNTNFQGDSIVFTRPKGDLRDNALRSLKVTAIPSTMTGKLPRQDTDAECPGATHTYKKSGGKKNACFYSDSDAAAIQRVFVQTTGNTNMAILYSDLKEDFCAISENIFENPGGGTCLELNAAKDLAKEYCSVGDRITGKGDGASCTRDNLDNYYNELAEAYCKGAGKSKEWCSCYNVTQGVCDTDSEAAGCDKKRRGFDKLVEGTPSEFKTQWNGMEGCFEGVCQGAVYKPENSNQNCDRSVQICVQDFDFNTISGGSTINATCNQTANTGTPPSVGDGPSGGGGRSGSGSGSGGGSGGGGGGIDDYIPRSIDELKTDSKKQMAVGGVSALFLMCCLLLVVVLVSSSGGGGGGPSRFRR